MDIKEVSSQPSVDCQKQTPNPAFALSHLWCLLLCWLPLNPFVLAYFSQFFHKRFSISIPDWPYYLWLLATTILGPFPATTEGRNRDYCLQTAFHILPICLGAVIIATTVQIFWRPRTLKGTVIRHFIWITGWFVWFAGAMYSVLCNMG